MRAKQAIAEYIGCDIADVEAYQPGRSRPQIHIYEGSYYVAVKTNKPPKADEGSEYDWKPMESEHCLKRTGYYVFASHS